MKVKKKRISLLIEPGLWDALHELAEDLSEYEDKVDASKLARQAIRDLLINMGKWPPKNDGGNND